MSNPFRYFNSSPEVIRLVVMMYVRYPLSLRNVEDLLAERGIDISHETVRFWWNRFGPMFAAEIRKRRVAHMRGYPQWRWHLDEVFVKALVQIAGAGKCPVLYCRDFKLGARHSTLQAQVDLGHPDVPVRIVPCGCDASIRYRRS